MTRWTVDGWSTIGLSMVAGAIGLLMTSCALTPAQKASGVTPGQLFCAKATAAGPLVVALTDALGAPIVVTGLASAVVAAACQSIDATPVSPPAAPTAAPVVAAPVTVGPGGVTAVPVAK